MDEELGHRDGVGPATRRLREFNGGDGSGVIDLVFGGYGEASDGVWSLLDHMATSRLI